LLHQFRGMGQRIFGAGGDHLSFGHKYCRVTYGCSFCL
jgi:hypothetical protein